MFFFQNKDQTKKTPVFKTVVITSISFRSSEKNCVSRNSSKSLNTQYAMAVKNEKDTSYCAKLKKLHNLFGLEERKYWM